MQTLIANQFVTAAGWDRAYQFDTARNYCGGDEGHARAVAQGHDTAWTVNTGSCIVSDRTWAAAKLAEEAEQLRTATIVDDGEMVEIEGETFTVRVMGQRFADPIHFKREA